MEYEIKINYYEYNSCKDLNTHNYRNGQSHSKSTLKPEDCFLWNQRYSDLSEVFCNVVQ